MRAMSSFILICSVLLYLSTHSTPFLLANTNLTDQEALLAFKAEIANDPDSVLSSWNNSLHFCQWKGVTCDVSHNRVISLNLSSSNLVGTLSPFIGNLSFLDELILDSNSFRGNIPSQLSRLSSLLALSLADNSFEGEIPHDIGRLNNLTYLSLGYNLISGTIPDSLYNLSNLQTLYLSQNKIHGYLPNDLGLRLPQLSYLQISDNFLTGQVPTSLSNLSKLKRLEISNNNFTGKFSLDGNNLPQLYCLDIYGSFPLGQESTDLSFLETLTNCNLLEHLLIGGNHFTGVFPRSILNLSTNLTDLDLQNNQMTGQLPIGLAKFVNLQQLYLNDNNFVGRIPADIGNLKNLELLYLFNNNFSQEIPNSLGNITKLSTLSLSNNNLQGSLPNGLGKCKNLQRLDLSSNKLSGVLPVELFNASSLLELSIGHNNMEGPLPGEISMLKNLVSLNVSDNRFSDEIPSTLRSCTSLTTLEMSGNSFDGSIPNSLSSLKSIQYLDLSRNNLSGKIPTYFSSWTDLVNLNLSFNTLQGEVPVNGVFANTTVVSVVGNSKLCGGIPKLHLPKCSLHTKLTKTMIMIISVVCVLVILISLVLCLYLLCSPNKRKVHSSELQEIKPFLEISYQMLSRATDSFSLSNLIGVGGFGSVYKGVLDTGGLKMMVAVKVMNLRNERASKSFLAECNALKNIRHRNLVKIITACSSIDSQLKDFKALVYEFIPGGSLDSWLHDVFDDHQSTLTLSQRLSIAIDVASALEYLHIECANPIIHCDLKPTNIFLDREMTAHVGDFGLAKFLSGVSTSSIGSQSSLTQVRGTVGYAAPEYGLGSNVSVEGDIYSFGILVLEMMTSKKPTDEMFSDGLNLHDFAKSALPNQVMEIVDRRMLGDADTRKIECIKSLIMVGVQCSVEVPRERMNIKDVVNELKSAMHNLQSGGT